MVCTCGFGVGLLGHALLILGFWTDVSEVSKVSKSFLGISCGQLVRYGIEMILRAQTYVQYLQ